MKIKNNYKYSSEPLKNILNKIKNNKYVLPSWQREYVWKFDQVLKLFDSIYNNYPIGNIMLWNNTTSQELYYNFIDKCYYQGKKPNCENIYINSYKKKCKSIMDGQQRLTSLYLYLCENCKCYDQNDNEKKIYVNLNKQGSFAERPMDEENGWFDVKEIYNMEEKDFFMNHSEKKSNKTIRNNFRKFKKTFKDYKIHEFQINWSKKEALEVFDRLNSNGTILSNAEMIFSMIVNNNANQRKYLSKEMKKLNKKENNLHYSFKLDFFINVIKLIIMTKIEKNINDDKKENNKKIRNKSTINKIEIQENITEINKLLNPIIESTKKVKKDILENLGLDDSTIVSYNAIVPIVYYYYKKNRKVSDEEKNILKKCLIISMIFGVFSSSTNEVLNDMRKIINNLGKKKITINAIKKIELKHALIKSFKVKKEDIAERLDQLYYGNIITKCALRILYDAKDYKNYEFQDDHMHPKHMFRCDENYNKKTIKSKLKWETKKNNIANLQLLTKRENQEEKHAKPLKEWVESIKSEYNYKANFINKKIDLEFNSFEKFISHRKEGMIKKLYKKIKI